MPSSAVAVFRETLEAALHVLVGYQDRPTGIQLVFYVATLVTIAALMWIVGAQPEKAPSKPDLREESCR